MNDILSLLELFLLAAALVIAASSYVMARRKEISWWHIIVFGPLSIAFSIAAYLLTKKASGGGGESDAYERLLAFLLLFGVVPIALYIDSLFVAAVAVFLARDRNFRIGAMVIAVGILAFFMLGLKSKASDGTAKISGKTVSAHPASSRIDGQAWALEQGISDERKCREQSSNNNFIEGCAFQAQRQR